MVQKSVVADFIAFGISRRKTRQQHGAQSNTQKRRWEFHQTVGVIEPRHGTMPEPARNVGVDEDGELRHAHTENSRGHQSEYAPHG
ncbi:unknown [Sutterella wadsworthensis CAG:135]|nr:unknown [Sutterella wadsworthensis CAG:135]